MDPRRRRILDDIAILYITCLYYGPSWSLLITFGVWVGWIYLFRWNDLLILLVDASLYLFDGCPTFLLRAYRCKQFAPVVFVVKRFGFLLKVSD